MAPPTFLPRSSSTQVHPVRARCFQRSRQGRLFSPPSLFNFDWQPGDFTFLKTSTGRRSQLLPGPPRATFQGRGSQEDRSDFHFHELERERFRRRPRSSSAGVSWRTSMHGGAATPTSAEAVNNFDCSRARGGTRTRSASTGQT